MLNKEQLEKFYETDIKCKCCNKTLGKPSFTIYSKYFMGYTVDGRRRLFCDEDCYNDYWNQYIVEENENGKIYKVYSEKLNKQVFILYPASFYGFLTIEEARTRLSMKNVATVNMGMFMLHNNMLFGNDD